TRCLSDWSSDVCSSDLTAKSRPIPADGFHAAQNSPHSLGLAAGLRTVTISSSPHRIYGCEHTYDRLFLCLFTAGFCAGSELKTEIGRASGRERVKRTVV